jgi:Sensors of blue-light using FAD
VRSDIEEKYEMKKLIQLIYISRSTFTPEGLQMGIESNVARILAKSRINNRRNGLVGVLYFGDGCFFQCIEGEEAAVDTLYAKLAADTRHKDIIVFSRKVVNALSFPDWAMKYVPIEKPMTQLLQAGGYKTFDPYKFDAEMTQRVMTLLHASSDPTAANEAKLPAQQTPASKSKRKNNANLITIAVVLSLIVIGVVIFLMKK